MVVVSDVTPVSVFSSLNVARGGMTKAVMRRANMFTEHFDDVRILTLLFQESLAAGTPVVVYNFKYGPKDVIRDGLDGFVVPKGDQKALAGKIIEIMKNPPLRERMSNHALEIVERFSFEKYEKNWVQLVKELEAEKPKNKPTMKSKLKKGFKKLLKL